MEYYEAPDYAWEQSGTPKLFLAGGITGVEDWQSNAKDILYANPFLDIAILNPRRKDFDMKDPSAAREQITWEYEALKRTEAILFWFPKGQVQPIALFELGRWSAHFVTKKIFVGCDKDYERKEDIVVQLGLSRQEINVKHSLVEVLEQAMHWKPFSHRK